MLPSTLGSVCLGSVALDPPLSRKDVLPGAAAISLGPRDPPPAPPRAADTPETMPLANEGCVPPASATPIAASSEIACLPTLRRGAVPLPLASTPISIPAALMSIFKIAASLFNLRRNRNTPLHKGHPNPPATSFFRRAFAVCLAVGPGSPTFQAAEPLRSPPLGLLWGELINGHQEAHKKSKRGEWDAIVIEVIRRARVLKRQQQEH